MFRRLWHCFAVFSLTLFLATAALWARGKIVDWDGLGLGYLSERGQRETIESIEKYQVTRVGEHGAQSDGIYCASERGSFGLMYVRERFGAGESVLTETQPGWQTLGGIPFEIRQTFPSGGFAFESERVYRGQVLKVIVPYWAISLITSLPPILLLAQIVRRRRVAETRGFEAVDSLNCRPIKGDI